MQKVIAKIHLKNIRCNAEVFKNLTGKPICAVIKANAYGHGAEEVASALEKVADMFAVSLIDEGKAAYTAACGKDILVLTPPLCEEEVASALAYGFILTVSDLSTARLIARVAEKHKTPARTHLKVNTGMNRYGMNAQTLGKTCKFLQTSKWVKVEGLYSHLYGNTKTQAEKQRLRFLQMQRIAKGYFPKLLCHLSATYGALLGEEFLFDMTRIGLGLYGYLPDGAAQLRTLPLKKGMEVYAFVATSRKFVDGGAGYGKERTNPPKDGRLAVLRFGYADGFLRNQKNGVCGFENNANNLCMDACVREGKYEKGKWTPVLTDAATTAKETGTIAYEVLCAATRRAELLFDWD